MRYLPVLLVTAACAVGPDYQRPDIPLPENYRTDYADTTSSAPWWYGFGDGDLNRLMAAALTQNLSVEAAEARLAVAEAFVRAERSDLLPIIDGGVDGIASEGASPVATAGLFAAVTPDLFGATRREIEAAVANAEGAASSLVNVKRLTAGALAAAYVELRRTDARILLLEQSLDLQAQTLRIVRLRAEAGLAADLDVQRAASDLAQTRAQRGPLAASRADADYTISLLLGEAPGVDAVPPLEGAPVPLFDGGPEAGVPADLIRSRPDVQAAEAALARATALIGAELADLYPSLRLNGSITTRLDNGAFASDAVSRAAAVLDVPLIDFGRRRAEVRAARAAADAALAEYRLALFSALGDVESALIAIEAAEARRSDLAEAVKASAIAFDQLQALYTEGLATLIDVLDAQRQLIAGRERFTDSEAALAQAYVALYVALGSPTDIAT